MLPSAAGMDPSSAGAPSPTPFYELHFPRLMDIAISEFHLSTGQATALVHDVLLSAVVHDKGTPDMESWLDGALRAAVRRLREVRS